MENENTAVKEQGEEQNQESSLKTGLRGEVEELMVYVSPQRRQQVKDFVEIMDKKGLFEAPASAVHHCNFEGGLMVHSVGVTKTLLKIKEAILPDNNLDTKIMVKDESCVIVGLFHDIYKAVDGFGRSHYVQYLTPTGKTSDKKPYEGNKQEIALVGGYHSALIVSQYIDLYEHELQAICGHDGMYVPENRELKMKEHPLLLMLHFADMWNGSLVENEKSWIYRKVSDLAFCKEKVDAPS